MIIRTIPLRQKDVFIINDVPVKKEIENGDKFSAISNLNLLGAFRKGGLNAGIPGEARPGILYNDIYTSYLDYSYFGSPELEENFDFNKEFKHHRDLVKITSKDLILGETLVEGEEIFVPSGTAENVLAHEFIKLEHQKDVYISKRLHDCLQDLIREIRACQPKMIICTGKWGLFFLTGCTSLTANLGTIYDRKPFGGLNKFRSSILQIHETFGITFPHILVPIYHPVNALTMPDKAYVIDMDIQKLCYMFGKMKTIGIEYYLKPPIVPIIGDTKEKVFSYLNELKEKLSQGETLVSIDIETMFSATIDCVGLAYEINRGICIPFCYKGNSSFWPMEEEIEILIKLREILLNKNCKHIGQNYSYDCQYFYKIFGLSIFPAHDTMILHHLLFNKSPKDLAFLASIYCEHYIYWKDNIASIEENPEIRWRYNISDVCYTLEILQNLLGILDSIGDKALKELYQFQVLKLLPETVKTMNKGVRVNNEMKTELFNYFNNFLLQVPGEINEILGFAYNNNSSPQKKKLFKDFFQMALKSVKKKGKAKASETCDAAAMIIYTNEYPLLKPFLMCLLEFSALSKFTSTFLGMKLDNDGRARTQYKITGTALGRLASVKNVWGGGGNFQNIPEKGKIPIYWLLQLLNQADGDIALEKESEEFIKSFNEEIEEIIEIGE
jgi:hypothetical protein